ncbi:TetR/AcrR family transcriptional regulator [Sediminibacillus halophilus]|uniref:DNA-binding transcriptional regulator, AcrR family n=1 Tax=Sediminibacillus halophilus TaxID=482461 RepID=A0A1G9X4G7_9BACI|nr:TetR/AcrR family transcriptional regulator [Sediminibacillus halophilus]SDM91639.1 DNA-binding transcriptional regulator, AcrR family [Sediminibacillus halophilus]
MNEKKRNIIEASIALFAEKGFYATSVQEIVDKSNLSKGSFYLHFRSKDELMLRIFEYYYDLMNSKVEEVRQENLPPKESFIKQIRIQLEEIIKHKDFIITQFREQTISLNEELFEFIRQKDIEIKRWYEQNLINMYGDRAEAYVVDLGVIVEGMLSNYMQLSIKYGVELDFHKMAVFLVRRLDDIVEGIFDSGEEPLITKEQLLESAQLMKLPPDSVKQKIEKDLMEMQEVVNQLDLDSAKATELQGVIDYLSSEMRKAEPKKFLIQGLLANFKGVSELDEFRHRIAERLQIRLL